MWDARQKCLEIQQKLNTEQETKLQEREVFQKQLQTLNEENEQLHRENQKLSSESSAENKRLKQENSELKEQMEKNRQKSVQYIKGLEDKIERLEKEPKSVQVKEKKAPYEKCKVCRRSLIEAEMELLKIEQRKWKMKTGGYYALQGILLIYGIGTTLLSVFQSEYFMNDLGYFFENIVMVFYEWGQVSVAVYKWLQEYWGFIENEMIEVVCIWLFTILLNAVIWLVPLGLCGVGIYKFAEFYQEECADCISVSDFMSCR